MAKIGSKLNLILTPQPLSGLQVPPDLKAYEELEEMLEQYEDQQRELCLQRCKTASQLIKAGWREGQTPDDLLIEAIIYTVCFQ